MFGNDEDVDGCLRIDISEREGQVVLINDVCGNLFADDFAEKRFLSCHGCNEGRRKKEEGRRKKEEGRRKKAQVGGGKREGPSGKGEGEEGRGKAQVRREKGKREEGRPSRREERGEKEEARKSFSCLFRYSLVIVNHNR